MFELHSDTVQFSREKIVMKLVTTRSVDDIEQLLHDFWKQTLLLTLLVEGWGVCVCVWLGGVEGRHLCG